MLEKNKIVNNFNNLLTIIERLRDDEAGCEWCKQQTSESIAKYSFEEANEVIEAIKSGDNSRICEELGDLLFQVIFHSEIKKEENAFSINDVIESINEKMIRRNPHVFDNKDNKKFTIDEIDKNWKRIKKEEKL
ncbi:MAG: hypothetical protein HOB71_03790 [Alphaproteobacteria bacterium]|nr:hypothetical protein [Alphaproteobacteria bacterium]